MLKINLLKESEGIYTDTISKNGDLFYIERYFLFKL